MYFFLVVKKTGKYKGYLAIKQTKIQKLLQGKTARSEPAHRLHFR